MKQASDFKDLMGFLLGPVRERPGMYLGESRLSCLGSFITGYTICLDINSAADRYVGAYGKPGFVEWLFRKKNVPFASHWEQPFLQEANNDEQKALQLYFQYLEEFSRQFEPQ